jgi:hypothetical protein
MGFNGFRTRNAGRAGAQPYHVTLAGRVPYVRRRIARERVRGARPLLQPHRLIRSSNPGLLRRGAVYTTRVAAPTLDYCV